MALDAYPVRDSYWSDGPEPGPRLTEDLVADVVVVGAGLAGLSSAYFLERAEPGLSVVVLEAGHVGAGASGRNFGSVPQLGRSDPDLLEDLLGPAEARFVVDHQARMLEDFESLLHEEDIACDYERSNVLLLARDDRSRDRVEYLAAAHQRLGYPSQLLTAEEVCSCVRVASLGGLSCGRQGFVDPFALTTGLAAAARRRGVRIYEASPVIRLARKTRRVVVGTPAGSVVADRCVLATNAYSPALGAGRGWIAPTYTYVLATAPLDEDQRRGLGWDTARHRQAFDAGQIGDYYYMQLRPNGQFLMGGGLAPTSPDGVRLPRHDDPVHYRRIHEEMVRRFPVLASAEIVGAWGGPIAMTPTGLPTTAALDEQLFVNAGYNGRGALMATLSGKVLAGRLAPQVHADDHADDYVRYARDLLELRADEISVPWS
jgi:glycine/D-amino acid oxidase-like deaminating enzyme